MNHFLRFIFSLAFIFSLLTTPLHLTAITHVGIGKRHLIPPIGTPSAGYIEREGKGMTGIHDPLLATAIVIHNGKKMIAFCSVDHMGFLSEMSQTVIQKIHSHIDLAACEVYIASSHTHSGGGAYFNIPFVGEMLAGAYQADIAQFYVDSAVSAILDAYKNLRPAKIGIGYGQTDGLTSYTGVWPTEIKAPSDITLIKVTTLDGLPLAAISNTPIYPAILDKNNMLFSADLVGYARDHMISLIGESVTPIFINGAIGDIETNKLYPHDLFKSCDAIGKSLAETICDIWKSTQVDHEIEISTLRDSYWFETKPTLSGFQIPIEGCLSEINLIILNPRLSSLQK